MCKGSDLWQDKLMRIHHGVYHVSYVQRVYLSPIKPDLSKSYFPFLGFLSSKDFGLLSKFSEVVFVRLSKR